jgi:hypothetical protein
MDGTLMSKEIASLAECPLASRDITAIFRLELKMNAFDVIWKISQYIASASG